MSCYDKTEQINRKLKTDKRVERVEREYMRYEVRLKSSQKIQKLLGTNKVFCLKDENISEFFLKFVEENISAPYSMYSSDRDKKIKKILKSLYVPGSRTWIRDALFLIARIEIHKGVPLLLDIENLIPLLDHLPFETRQSKYNAKKTFLSLCADSPNVYEGDVNKMQEVLMKLING